LGKFSQVPASSQTNLTKADGQEHPVYEVLNQAIPEERLRQGDLEDTLAVSPCVVSEVTPSYVRVTTSSTSRLVGDLGESSASRSPSRIQPIGTATDLVEVRFASSKVERVETNRFMIPEAEIPYDAIQQWANIQPKLDQALKLVTAKLGLRFDEIITSARFVVVGWKEGAKIVGSPTVVITCGSKKCERLVRKALRKGYFECVKELQQLAVVRYKAPPALWYASQSSSPALSTIAVGESKQTAKEGPPRLLSWRQYPIFIEKSVVEDSACARKLKYDDKLDGRRQVRYSTVGGVITVDGELYCPTSARAILASFGTSGLPKKIWLRSWDETKR
jgi:hypothetical protein